MRAEPPFESGGWHNFCNDGRLDEALIALKSQLQEGTSVSTNQLYRLLKACDESQDMTVGRDIHSLVVKCGYETNMFLGNHLIRMYASRGHLLEADLVFGKIPSPSIFMWTSIISAHVDCGEPKKAIEMYLNMKLSGIEPDDHLFVAALKACASAADVSSGKIVHADVRARGVESNVFVGNALVDMYCKCHNLPEAREVFNMLANRNLATWTCIIGGCALCGQGDEALKLYFRMQEEGLQPDKITFINVLRACGSPEALQAGKHIHSQILDMGLGNDECIGNALVSMYTRSGSLADAREVFEKLSSKTMATWNTMVAGYALHDESEKSLQLFYVMQNNGMVPDHVTFVSTLNACSSLGALHEGRRIHSQILELGLESDGFIGNALVDMYAKCGSLQNAQLLFDRLPKRDVGTWTALINGHGLHNDCRMAISCFGAMREEGVQPDAALFCCLLIACSHVGLVKEGELYFNSMSKEYGIMPVVEHYTCMVDLLGRSGRLEEADYLWRHMPFEQDYVGWLSLLTSCKAHDKLELGRLCFDQLVQLDPSVASGYVLMASMYTDAGKWEDSRDIHALRKQAAAQKKPAVASIQIDNRVLEFSVGKKRADTSAKLKSLTAQARGQDYVEQQILQEKDQVEQAASGLEFLPGREIEDGLCGHAEKLALAYGLLNTPRSTTLLISKNLRMCSHCHNGTKMISSIEGREIVVRDAHRVHHFKDGICSCDDDS